MKYYAIAIVASLLLIWLWRRRRRKSRIDYIRTYTFPPALYDKLRKRHPELSVKDCQLVGRALRQFFLGYLQGGCRYVSMPSQVTDDLWHELILYTRHYRTFCKKAFGRFLHHTPAVVLDSNRQNNAGLRHIWCQACHDENIDPRKPSRLPLLFAIDQELNIAGGFSYVPDCRALRTAYSGSTTSIPYCCGDFFTTDSSGLDFGFDDWSDTGDDGGGSDSSCGGDGGCGGGCGGD